MPFDNSWKALLKPGDATEYFTRSEIPPFEPDDTDYNPANAWWLAELCRLVYCDRVAIRRSALAQVNLHRRRFFDVDETQGFIVEARDKSFTVLVFRGTAQLEDWLVNLEITAEDWEKGGQVHEGFQEALDDVWGEIEPVLDQSSGPVFYTGHSLGAALATLAASLRPPRALYTYGSPRVGDAAFVETLQDVPVYRVVNNRDAVTTVPPSLPHLKLVHTGDIKNENHALHYITHDNKIWVNPTADEVQDDRERSAAALDDTVDRRRWFDPPQRLSDHSPINYVTHLERGLE